MSQGMVDTGCVARVQAAMTAARAAQHRVLEAVAELAAGGVAAATGYRSEQRLLQDALRVNPAEATRMVRRACDLVPTVSLTGQTLPPVLPATAAAHSRGLLSEGHVAVITAALDHLAEVPGLDPDTLAQAEASLARHAATLAPAGLLRVAQRVIARLDPDGVAPEEGPVPDDEVHLARRRRGGVAMTLRFHGEADAEMLVEVLDAMSGPAGPEDTRVLAERRAEAMKDLLAAALSPTGVATDTVHEAPVEIPDPWHPDPFPTTDDTATDDTATDDTATDDTATEDTVENGETEDPAAENADGEDVERGDGEPGPSEPAPPPGAGPAPGPPPGAGVGSRGGSGAGRALLAVTMDLDTLRDRVGHGLLDSDHPVSPDTARRLACDAGIVPTVLGSRSEPLDVGRLSYTVPESLRRALALRDGGCAFPGCPRRPRRCHAHHLRHWIDGGPTCLANIRPCE